MHKNEGRSQLLRNLSEANQYIRSLQHKVGALTKSFLPISMLAAFVCRQFLGLHFVVFSEMLFVDSFT